MGILKAKAKTFAESEQTTNNIHHLSQVSQRDMCMHGDFESKNKTFAESEQTSRNIHHLSQVSPRDMYAWGF